MLGCVLGAIGFLRVAVWAQFSDVYGPHCMLIAITVGLSLIGVVLWGSLSGSMLPFFLRRMGADPATSSAPFVATLVDVTGLVIYFSIAILISCAARCCRASLGGGADFDPLVARARIRHRLHDAHVADAIRQNPDAD